MNTITITLTDEQLQQLQATATRFRVAPEELIRISLEELLNRPDEEFVRVLEYVLAKYEIQAGVEEQEEIILKVAAGEVDRSMFVAWLANHIQPYNLPSFEYSKA